MTETLKPEIKERWVNALRSGKYRQGKTELVQPDCKLGEGLVYCCLGVLCDLASEDGVVPKLSSLYSTDRWPTDESGTTVSPAEWRWTQEEDSGLPCDAVVEWAFGAAVDNIPRYLYYSDTSRKTLYYMNDTGSSFEEIADVIEMEF